MDFNRIWTRSAANCCQLNLYFCDAHICIEVGTSNMLQKHFLIDNKTRKFSLFTLTESFSFLISP